MRSSLIPIARAVDRKKRIEIDDVSVERRPAQRQSNRSFLNDNRTMTRDLDLQPDGFRLRAIVDVSYSDLFHPHVCGPPTGRRLVEIRIT